MAVQSLGDNQYIENLAINVNANTVNVDKLIKPTASSLSIVNGNMFLAPYSISNLDYIVDLELSFTDNTTNDIYTYKYANFGARTSNLEIDFTSTQVFDTSQNAQILPSGEYRVKLQYVTDDANIMDSDMQEFASVTKLAYDTSSIRIFDYNFYLMSSSSNDLSFNYVLTYPNGNSNAVNGTGNTINMQSYPSGNYAISVQIVESNKLKSQYSSAYAFTKLSDISLNRELIHTSSVYKMHVWFSVPDVNYTDHDLASTYSLTINNLTYNIAANRSNNYVAQDQNTSTAISVTYSNRRYDIYVDITDRPLLTDNGSGNYVILSNESGIIDFIGLPSTTDTISISLTKISGNDVVSVDSSSSVGFTKLQSSQDTIEIRNGILYYSGPTNIEGKIYFYKNIENNYYNNTPSYIWSVNGSGQLDLSDGVGLDAGSYLIALKYDGDVDSYVIDSDTQHIVATIVATPKVYIDNGVLYWTQADVAGADVTYILSVKYPNGDNVTQELENITTLDMNSLSYPAGEYKVTVRARVDRFLISHSSDTFTAYKLANPNLDSVINETGLTIQDRTVKLVWNRIDNATSYDLYDYCVADESCTSVNIIQTTQLSYEQDIDRDVVLGNHIYYLIANGSASTRDNGVYASSGYVNGYNCYNNTDTTAIASTTIVTNTTDNIYVEDGVIYWTPVEHIDYYVVSMSMTLEDNSTSQYITSTANSYIDILQLGVSDLANTKVISVSIANMTTVGEYTVVATTATRPLLSATVMTRLQNKMYQDISISRGMIRYTISSTYINELITLINNEYDMSLDLNMSNIFDDSDIMEAFVKPIISINSVEYELGEDIVNHYYEVYDNLDNLTDTFIFDDIAEHTVPSSASYIYVYIPIPNEYPNGDYTITFRALGNTTSQPSDVGFTNSFTTNGITGYKLDYPKNVSIDATDYEMSYGILKFATPSTKNNSYVESYELTIAATDNASDTQTVVVYVTEDSSKLYTYNYGGIIDEINEIVSIDIYKLFVINSTALNRSGGLYYGFVSLRADVNYNITIRAMGEYIYNSTAHDLDNSYKYFNSNISRLSTSFKIISAPTLYIQNSCINWTISSDVSSYKIFFYDSSDRLIYSEELNDIPNRAVMSYSNIRNNENLASGMYKIKVQAIGNGINKLDSRLSDCDLFMAEKLAPVEVKVENGLYTWTNSTFKLLYTSEYGYVTNIGTFNYPYYLINIYSSEDNYATVKQSEVYDRSIEVNSSTLFSLPRTTIYELPETLSSEYTYKIKVYAYTNPVNFLLPSDDNTDFVDQVARSRSNAISGKLKVTQDGEIAINDTNTNNNYIVFIYNEANNLLFTSNNITTKNFNIYNLYDLNGNIFEANTGYYYIRIKSIDKAKPSDTIVTTVNQQDGILRSCFNEKILIRLISDPAFKLQEGVLDWSTVKDIMGHELTSSRVIISGNFVDNSGNTITGKQLRYDFDNTVTSLQLTQIRVKRIETGDGDVIYYQYNPSDYDDILKFVEGSNYSISIRFIGLEDEELDYNNTNAYLMSTRASIRNTVLLNNPAKAVNPKIYKNSSDSTELTIYDSIPNDYEYKNYIFFNYSEVNGVNIVNYNVEVYIRDKNNIEASSLVYTYLLRDIANTCHVTLQNNLLGTSEDISSNNIVSVENCGIYIALDNELNAIIGSGQYNFNDVDICVYIQAIGSTVDNTSNDNPDKVTYYYSMDSKLQDSDMYMLITIPNVPTNLAYDNKGLITWDSVAVDLGYELIVAYKVDNTLTVESVHYDNIVRTILSGSIDNSTKLKIMNMLNITEYEYNNMFNTTDTYYIDKITLDPGTEYYKLRYLSRDIKEIAIRAIGIMSVGGGDTVEEFISGPCTLKNSGMLFTLYGGGDGSEDSHFILSNFSDIEPYIDEKCYFDMAYGTYTLSATGLIGGKYAKTFNGYLEGNNSTLNITYGYTEITSGLYSSLFYSIDDGAVIMNLNINVSNSGYIIDDSKNEYFGALAIYNYGQIYNVNVTGSIQFRMTDTQGNTLLLGGLVTYNNGTIAYSEVSANISTSVDTYESYVGGIAYQNGSADYAGYIYMTTFNGLIYSRFMGGIVDAMANGTISYCRNIGSMVYCTVATTTYTYNMGGIARVISNYYGNEYKDVTISNTYVNLANLIIGTTSTIQINGITINNYTCDDTVTFVGIAIANAQQSGHINITTCYVDCISISTNGANINLYGVSDNNSYNQVSYSNVYYNSEKFSNGFNQATNTSDCTAYTGSSYNGYNASYYYDGDKSKNQINTLDYYYSSSAGKVVKRTE